MRNPIMTEIYSVFPDIIRWPVIFLGEHTLNHMYAAGTLNAKLGIKRTSFVKVFSPVSIIPVCFKQGIFP